MELSEEQWNEMVKLINEINEEEERTKQFLRNSQANEHELNLQDEE